MDFQKGNNFWRLRSKHGRDRIIQDANSLLESCYEYFDITSNRKFLKQEWVGKDAIEVHEERHVPFTKQGLAIFLGVARWERIEDLKKVSHDFYEIITWAENVIFTQKFELAASGFFNANIIAKDLGLIDKIESRNNNNISFVWEEAPIKTQQENDN